MFMMMRSRCADAGRKRLAGSQSTLPPLGLQPCKLLSRLLFCSNTICLDDFLSWARPGLIQWVDYFDALFIFRLFRPPPLSALQITYGPWNPSGGRAHAQAAALSRQCNAVKWQSRASLHRVSRGKACCLLRWATVPLVFAGNFSAGLRNAISGHRLQH